MTERSDLLSTRIKAEIETEPSIERMNAFDISNAMELVWQVRHYRVTSIDGRPISHDVRATSKAAVWDHYRNHKATCRGLGFVLDLSPTDLVVPATWLLPDGVLGSTGLKLSFVKEIAASPRHRHTQGIVEGILREGLKKQLKDVRSDDLGGLWQDFNRFCQIPKFNGARGPVFCRRFGVVAKQLSGGRWVFMVDVGTTAVDHDSLADYYRRGQVANVVELMDRKRQGRSTRDNRPVAIRVLKVMRNFNQTDVDVLELTQPDILESHATLEGREQTALASGFVDACKFGKKPSACKLAELHLILDSQITLGDHDETIVDPTDRFTFAGLVRGMLDGANIYGQAISLGLHATALQPSESGTILPPRIWVGDKSIHPELLPSPSTPEESALKNRGRERVRLVRQKGFFQSRPIHPVLAVPRNRFTPSRSQRMRSDLHRIWQEWGIPYTFSIQEYSDAYELSSIIEKDGYDTAMIVLPENSRESYQGNDTHEQVKRALEIPSQCIHHDNTLPESLVSQALSPQDRLARRIRNRYELCLANLLVKNNWIPFVPAEPFSYNVHVGIDVGGTHNNTAMLCVGHGYAKPHLGITFLPEEIPIGMQKAEPIPSQKLFAGLDQTFSTLRRGVEDAGGQVDFSTVLFFRDGHFFGFEEEWNELDAIRELHQRFLERGWISGEAKWTAVEVLKLAEGWRIFRCNETSAANPLVGCYTFPFDDPNEGLVCTTGEPYLTQGTASPLRFRIHQIAGELDRTEIVTEIVWEADMCFTKLDSGQRLPWVLGVADAGALQASRQYRITGIPA